MRAAVQVLLSCYNGEKYIREQLDSILAQREVQVEILVRDDGSTDGTVRILEEYREAHENITVLYGANCGAMKSFFSLLEASDRDVPYTAFSDQDDVWLPDKLARAVAQLSEHEQNLPLAYCSERQLTDAKLQPIKSAVRYSRVETGFGNALVENMCAGCTCVINGALLSLLRGKVPENAVMHDFWIYLAGTCFGTVIYDRVSRILYRQHGANEIGAAGSPLESWRRRAASFKRLRGRYTGQAAEFLRMYREQMPEEKRKLAEEFAGTGKSRRLRWRLVFRRKIFRQRKTDQLIFSLLLLAGRL